MTNSSTPQPNTQRKRRLAAGALAVAILLLFEFGVARTKWAYEQTPGVFVNSIYALEDNVIDPGPEPEVVVFGSSRLQDSVAPRLLEEQLGLRDGGAMNLAFPFGDVVASRLLYERNRDKLSEARVAVIGVEMWDLFGERQLDPIQEFFLPMDERLEHHGKDRLSLLISSVWKTYAMRKMAGYIAGGILRGGPDLGPLTSDGRLKYFAGDELGPVSIDAAVQFEDRFAELEKHETLTGTGDRGELQRFIDLLVGDGIEVIVVHLPMRTDFFPEVERRLPALTVETRRILDSLIGPAKVEVVTTLDTLGIPDNYFRDFGHAAEAGVAPLTSYVASLFAGVAGL